MKLTSSIASKLIVGSLIIMLLATIPLAFKSAKYFEDVSVEKEEETNLQTAVSKAVEIDHILKGLLEKSKFLGSLYLQASKTGQTELLDSLNQLMNTERDIFAMDIYNMDDGDLKLKNSLVKSQLLKELNKDQGLIETIREKIPFPVASVAQGNIEIQVATVDKDIPLMIIGFPLSRNELGRINAVTLTYLQLSRLQRSFASQGSRKVFLLDAKGGVLAHPDESLVLQGKSLIEHPAYQDSLIDSSPRKKLKYDLENEKFRGALARTAFGPLVVSQISEEAIKQPAYQSRRQSIFITGIVISLSLLLVFIISITFSRPIETLAGFIKEVSNGNYEISAKAQIKSNDELGLLANAFDEMVVGLKERAKAFAVMRQALGKTVINTLMTMSEEDMGGQRKPVAVLFSDLRGFTKFSEGHTPEEVVSMLNEYFDVMVKVIEKHNGWLDKFIGDAIMAVWGVPYPNEGDIQRATLAAIDMRIALNELNEKRIAKGLSPIMIGIGLHCGDAIVGKIGATERANLTVIGDTVNQASRIEAATKAFGTDILLSQEMVDSLGSMFWTELAGAAEVKGKADTLKMYKVRGYKETQEQDFIEVRTPYSEYKAEGADKIKVA